MERERERDSERANLDVGIVKDIYMEKEEDSDMNELRERER